MRKSRRCMSVLESCSVMRTSGSLLKSLENVTKNAFLADIIEQVMEATLVQTQRSRTFGLAPTTMIVGIHDEACAAQWLPSCTGFTPRSVAADC